jgi:hypothetical protein
MNPKQRQLKVHNIQLALKSVRERIVNEHASPEWAIPILAKSINDLVDIVDDLAASFDHEQEKPQ